MRIRSFITATALTGLLAAGILRCKLPDEPGGPHALSTPNAFVHIAFVNVPAGGVIDRPALVASLEQIDVNTVILRTSADETGTFVDDRVSLAIELQRSLVNALVLIGTYESTTRNARPMAQLLAPDPTFTRCYPTGGPTLDPNGALIDKLRVCSMDTSNEIVAALKAQNASSQIGCYVSQETELVDTLNDDAKAKVAALFHDSAAACASAGLFVGITPVVSTQSGDPARAGVLMRESLQDSGVQLITLRDGVSADPAHPNRARVYYQGLRDAITDRDPRIVVAANVEAFECETTACTKTHPTSPQRYLAQLCGAKFAVEGIASSEYLHDLAGTTLFSSPLDGSADLESIAADLDASSQLRASYLGWRDAGAPCPPPADAGHD